MSRANQTTHSKIQELQDRLEYYETFIDTFQEKYDMLKKIIDLQSQNLESTNMMLKMLLRQKLESNTTGHAIKTSTSHEGGEQFSLHDEYSTLNESQTGDGFTDTQTAGDARDEKVTTKLQRRKVVA